MKFHLDLDRNSPPQCSSLVDESFEGHIPSLLSALCQVISDSGIGQFTVSGFGDDRWPVDEQTDLAVFLEQLPEAIDAIREPTTNRFVIDFYEQGVERTIHFDRVNEGYSARCESLLEWQPTTDVVKVSCADILNMLTDVETEFLQFTAQLRLNSESQSMLSEWARTNQ